MKIVEDIEKAWADKQYGQLVSYAKRLRDADLKGLPPHALSFLGVGCVLAGNKKQAIRPFWIAHQNDFSDLNARLNLANCLKDLGDFRGAREVYMESPSSMGDPLITLGAGICDFEIGRYHEAVKLLERSLELKRSKEALLNLGRSYMAIERLAQAKECFFQALQLDSSYLAAAINLSVCLIKTSEYEKAHSLGLQILNAGHRDDGYLQAMMKASLEVGAPRVGLSFFDHFGADANTTTKFLAAEGHRFLRNLDRATELCKQVVKSERNHFSAHIVLAHSLAEQGRISEAEKASSAAFRINEIDQLPAKYLPNPWTLFALSDDAALQFKVSKRYANATYNRFKRDLTRRKQKAKKTVIAYLSPDFGDHPVTQIMLPTLRGHNRDLCEIHAFSFRARPDQVTEEVKEAVDGYHDCNGMQYAELKSLSEKLGVDAVVDLAVYTSNGRPNYLALGLAPLQVNHLGYSGTSGANAYDFIVSDGFIIPPEFDQFYSERVIRLDSPLISGGLEFRGKIEAHDRLRYGIPEGAVVYGCLANPYKYTSAMLLAWVEILRAVPGSVLLFGRMEPPTFENLKRQLSAYGLSSERLLCSGDQPAKADHFGRLKLVDVFLDTYPYNAHSLAADAVSVGVPVVTLVGRSFASRVAGSLNASLGLDELNCESITAYVEKAVGLGLGVSERAQIEQKLVDAIQKKDWGLSYAVDFERKILAQVNAAGG